MSATNYGVFIEPKSLLKTAIEADKGRVMASCGEVPYLNHPPHMTLLAGDYAEPARWLQELTDAVSQFDQQIELQTDSYFIFTNDSLAGGGDTLVYRMEPDVFLLKLQQIVATVVGPHCLIPRREREGEAGFLASEPFHSSYVGYGFPFVGPHWIPHFTVASIPKGGDVSVFDQIMSQECSYQLRVHAISIWSINGDQHSCFARIPLCGDS